MKNTRDIQVKKKKKQNNKIIIAENRSIYLFKVIKYKDQLIDV